MKIRVSRYQLLMITLVFGATMVTVFYSGVTAREVSRAQIYSQNSKDSLSCKEKGIVETGGFCLDENKIFVGYNELWGPRLAGGIEEMAKDGSLVDFGAGLGHYGRYFLRKKERIFAENFHSKENEVYFDRDEVKKVLKKPQVIAKYEGYDGALNIEKVTSSFVKHLDLSQKQDLLRKFDWVMSLEVGEHVPAQYETILIENLVRHACRGIILSWAVEGQGGHFHVNNHNNSYVRDRLSEHGFNSCAEKEKFIREAADPDLEYFKNTLMVFTRRDHLADKNCVQNSVVSCE